MKKGLHDEAEIMYRRALKVRGYISASMLDPATPVTRDQSGAGFVGLGAAHRRLIGVLVHDCTN